MICTISWREGTKVRIWARPKKKGQERIICFCFPTESQAKLPFPSDFFPSHQTSQDTSNVSVDKATVSFPYKVTGFHHSYRLPLQLLNTAEWYCTRQFPSGYTWKEQFSLVCYLIITVQNNSNPNFEISCNCQNILHLKITVTKNRERERERAFVSPQFF